METEEELYARFWGEQLASVRREKGLTQQELAQRAGITFRGLYRIEHGLVSTKAFTLEQLARALGEDFGELRARVWKSVALVRRNG